MTTHDLKIWPEHFNLVLGGLKRFEVRRNDRGFELGDALLLREWEPFSRAYTGRETTRQVTCVTRAAGPAPLPDDLVVLGLNDPHHARLGGFIHDLAHELGAPCAFGAVEEEALLTRARQLRAAAGEAPRLPEVLELIRRAHTTVLMGSAPQAKADLGEAARLLAALIDGRV